MKKRIDSWQGPQPSGPDYISCGQRCPDCDELVTVAGAWDDWDRIHGAVCVRGQMSLPLEVTP